MLLLDTNVVSELRKVMAGRADPNAARWAASVNANTLFVSAITIYELELGVLLAERRDPRQGAVLRLWLETRVLSAFDGRTLPADAAVGRRAARLHISDPRPVIDALIAATALVHGMTVVTRNISDFEGFGVPLIDPWQDLPWSEATPRWGEPCWHESRNARSMERPLS